MRYPDPREHICRSRRAAWLLRSIINCAFVILILASLGTLACANTLTLAGVQQCPGNIARVPVHLALDPGTQVNGLTFRLEAMPGAGSPAIESPLDFEALALPAPSFKNSTATYLRVAWLQISPALSGTVHVGNLLVPVPAAAKPGNIYTVHVANVQANNGLNQVPVAPGPDVTLQVICCTAEHCDDGDPCTTDTCDPTSGQCTHAPSAAVDVGIARFNVPSDARVGQRRKLTVDIRNNGCSDALVECALSKGSQVLSVKRVSIPNGQTKRVTFAYKYSAGDVPQVCLTVVITAAGDVTPGDNERTGCTTVK